MRIEGGREEPIDDDEEEEEDKEDDKEEEEDEKDDEPEMEHDDEDELGVEDEEEEGEEADDDAEARVAVCASKHFMSKLITAGKKLPRGKSSSLSIGSCKQLAGSISACLRRAGVTACSFAQQLMMNRTLRERREASRI